MAQPSKKKKMLVKARRTISEVCGGRSWDSLLSTDKPQWRRRSFTAFTTRRRDQNKMKAKSSNTTRNATWKRCATSSRTAKKAYILPWKNPGLSGAADSGAIKFEWQAWKTMEKLTEKQFFKPLHHWPPLRGTAQPSQTMSKATGPREENVVVRKICTSKAQGGIGLIRRVHLALVREGVLWNIGGYVPSSLMETFKYKSCEAGKRGKAMNNICASLPNLCRLVTDPARHLVVCQFFSSAIGWCIDNPFLQWIQVHKGRGIDSENVLLLALRFELCLGERVLTLLPRRLLWHVCIVHIYGRAYSRGNTEAEDERGGVYTEGVWHAELPGEWSQANKFDKANLTSLTNASSIVNNLKYCNIKCAALAALICFNPLRTRLGPNDLRIKIQLCKKNAFHNLLTVRHRATMGWANNRLRRNMEKWWEMHHPTAICGSWGKFRTKNSNVANKQQPMCHPIRTPAGVRSAGWQSPGQRGTGRGGWGLELPVRLCSSRWLVPITWLLFGERLRDYITVVRVTRKILTWSSKFISDCFSLSQHGGGVS